jgi:hypothetical protein
MNGYTSPGAGTSGLPLRLHCPGEITLVTLRKAPSATFEPSKTSSEKVGTFYNQYRSIAFS